MATFSDDDDETLVTIGTPLDIPDEDEAIKKPIKLQDTLAKDDKGRTRFHGAFTGGFSAGYFNSVGSKEGWTPSTFASSRNERIKEEFRQKPEDFMDDEDMGEYGIAPKKFVTGSKFSSEERKKRQFDEAERATADTVLPGASALLEIIVPERLTVGVRLLRKMGWKEGQGIGPRLSKRQKTKTVSKVYGCLPPPEPDEVLDYDSIFSDVTFAPQDSSHVKMFVKVNTHGLGYRGLDPNKALPSSHVRLFEPPRVTKGGSRRGIRGQGFGVGALEDEDDDIYNVDSMSNYDMTMGGEEDDKFGWTGPSGKTASATPVTYVGRLLEGFTLSSKKLVQKKDFPPPKLPRDFRPVHRFQKDGNMSSLSTQSEHGVNYRLLLDKPVDSDRTVTELPSTSSSKRTVYTDAASRSLALEEKAFVGSVFDLISKESKEKLDRIKQGTDLTDNSASAGSNTACDSSNIAQSNQTTDKREDKKTTENKQTSGTPRQAGGPFSLAGFKPFQKDPGKQERYERYLELVNHGNKDPFSIIFTSNQTEWEIEKEKEEFTRAAKLYRPLSNMMAMRFTRAGHDDLDNNSKPPTKEKEDMNDEMKAANMKMFGKLTREVIEWHPDKVVCKRFNVPNPYPGSTYTGSSGVKRDKYSVFNFLNFADPTRSDTYHATETQGNKPDTSRQSDPDVNTTASKFSHESAKSDNKADDALNRGKSMKSIFSHLVDTESETQRTTKTVSFSLKSTKSSKPKQFKSIFSHLEKSENSVKVANDNIVTMETDTTDKTDRDVHKHSRVDDAGKKTEETGMDLFRAIFKNSDSEDSSSSSEESTKDSSIQDGSHIVDQNPVVIKTCPEIVDLQPEIEEDESVNEAVVTKLSGNNEEIETITSRLSPTVDSDDSYGPALPPTLSTPSMNVTASMKIPTSQEFIDLTQNSSYKHKHKSKKEKKDKHKKSKHKKKNKSKEKKRKKRGNRGNDSDTTDKDTDSDDDVDSEILSRLKSIKSSQKKKMMDLG